MILKIDILDTFFFRDGKPFSMGEENWADGIFPPAPSVIYGALRSLYMANHADGFSDTNIKKTESIYIKGVFLEIDGLLHLPFPKDFVLNKNDKENAEKLKERFLLEPVKFNNIGSNKVKYSLVIPPKYANKNVIAENLPENTLIQKMDFELEYATISEAIPNIGFIKPDEYLIAESKVGIGRNNQSATTELGLLYRVDMKRFLKEKTKIVVDFEGLNDFPKSSFLKIGGEGKTAHYEILNETIDFAKTSIVSNFFKLYLGTPCIFENAWLPKWINPETFKGKIGNCEVELQAVSMGKTISVGGFDMKNKMPKTMYKAIPAGSVYFFKLIEGTMQEIFDLLHQKSIADYEFAREGFGISYIAKSQSQN